MGQTKEERVIRQLSGKQTIQKQTPIATDMFLPNHSGIKSHPEMKKIIADIDLSPYWKSDGTSTATGNWSLGDKNLTTTGTGQFGDGYGVTLNYNDGSFNGAAYIINEGGYETWLGTDYGGIKWGIQTYTSFTVNNSGDYFPFYINTNVTSDDVLVNTDLGASRITLAPRFIDGELNEYGGYISFELSDINDWGNKKEALRLDYLGNITTTGTGTFGTSGQLGLEVKGTTELNQKVRIGSSVAPTVALDVTGAALISSTLGVTGNITLGDNSASDPRITFDSGNDGYIEWQEDELQFHIEGGVEISTWLNMGGSFFPKQVNDAGMDETNGTVGEIIFNTADTKFYGCTVTGTPATWAAFN